VAYKKGLGVDWYFPTEKRAFAHSTVATSDLITVLSEQYLTTKDVYNAINYDDEAKEIVNKFIQKGYGNYLFRDFVHTNSKLIYRKIENGEIIHIALKDLKKHLDKVVDSQLKVISTEYVGRYNDTTVYDVSIDYKGNRELITVEKKSLDMQEPNSKWEVFSDLPLTNGEKKYIVQAVSKKLHIVSIEPPPKKYEDFSNEEFEM